MFRRMTSILNCNWMPCVRPDAKKFLRTKSPGANSTARLGRSLPELLALVAQLEEKGIGLHSLNEQIRTDSSTGKLVFHIFAALAEFERNLIRERTVAGLASARARGRKGGRREKLTQQQSHEIRVLMKDPAVQVANIARQYKVSRSTIYRVIADSDNQA